MAVCFREIPNETARFPPISSSSSKFQNPYAVGNTRPFKSTILGTEILAIIELEI